MTSRVLGLALTVAALMFLAVVQPDAVKTGFTWLGDHVFTADAVDWLAATGRDIAAWAKSLFV